MKTLFWKQKNNLPSLKSLRPAIFDVDLFWFLSLGLGLVILIITGVIGGKLLYAQYFESYKKEGTQQNYGDVININRLKTAIRERTNFLDQPTPELPDPSL